MKDRRAERQGHCIRQRGRTVSRQNSLFRHTLVCACACLVLSRCSDPLDRRISCLLSITGREDVHQADRSAKRTHTRTWSVGSFYRHSHDCAHAEVKMVRAGDKTVSLDDKTIVRVIRTRGSVSGVLSALKRAQATFSLPAADHRQKGRHSTAFERRGPLQSLPTQTD